MFINHEEERCNKAGFRSGGSADKNEYAPVWQKSILFFQIFFDIFLSLFQIKALDKFRRFFVEVAA